jgi:predicted NUDIX family phosphoesterase
MAKVFVVDRAAFFAGQWPQGFHTIADEDAFIVRAHRLGRFVDRATAEEQPAWKQWIPYCVLRCQPPDGAAAAGDAAAGDPAQRGVFVVQRTRGQSEARLHGSWSIGLGGHIEPEDLLGGPAESGSAPQGAAFFRRALRRELTEELAVDPADLPEPKLLGIVNDDSTPVGSVHAGLVYAVDFPWSLAMARPRVGIREISKMRGGFGGLVEFADLWQDPMKFESWSQFLIEGGIVGAMGLGTGMHRRSTHDAEA